MVAVQGDMALTTVAWLDDGLHIVERMADLRLGRRSALKALSP